MTRSASLGSFATAVFSASIPSGFDVGPALMACIMCLPLYNTGNATDKRTGALPDSITFAKAAGCSSSPEAQGSEAASWPQQLQQASPKIARKAARFLWLIRKLSNSFHAFGQRLQKRGSPTGGCIRRSLL